MELAVDQSHFEIDNRESSQRTAVHDRFDTLFDTGNVFLGNRSADDPAFEGISLRPARLAK